VHQISLNPRIGKNKMLWITGASGFLGSHLINSFKDVNPICTSSKDVNLLCLEEVSKFVENNKITSVVHAAGFVGGIGLHKELPGDIALKNLRMGLNIIEAFSKIEGARVLIVSTVCIYPENASVPISENLQHDGYPSPVTAYYGIAKKTLHVLAEAVSKQANFEYLNVIPTNLYGPNDHYDELKSHVVPALIKRAHQAKVNGESEIVVWGDGTQIRDLLFVADAADWIRSIMDSNVKNETFNIGSRVGISIKDLTLAICDVVGFKGDVIWDTSKPSGASRRLLDTSKVDKMVNSAQLISMQDGLKMTYHDFIRRGLQ